MLEAVGKGDNVVGGVTFNKILVSFNIHSAKCVLQSAFGHMQLQYLLCINTNKLPNNGKG